MDITQLYQDYSISYVTEGKHYVSGWLTTKCPFCDDPSEHLGYNIDENYFNCYRCGSHFVDSTIAKLINVSEQEARIIIKQYGFSLSSISTKEPVVRIRAKAHRLPSGTGPMGTIHRIYLDRRNFDAEKLECEWNLIGTGPISKLDDINFKFRIIIPIIWQGKQVSFTSRDITGKAELRYITCPKDRELINHKTILYGKQEYWKETGICVEGPTDVWRLGRNSFCTFGIKYTEIQVRQIAKAFKRVFVMFDDDPQAVIQANKLVADLRFRGVEAIFIESIIASDPGSMKQSDADYLVKTLMK
jgi:hypothetical protein